VVLFSEFDSGTKTVLFSSVDFSEFDSLCDFFWIAQAFKCTRLPLCCMDFSEP